MKGNYTWAFFWSCMLFVFYGCHHPGGSFIYWAHVTVLKYRANVNHYISHMSWYCVCKSQEEGCILTDVKPLTSQPISSSCSRNFLIGIGHFHHSTRLGPKQAVRNTVQNIPEPLCLEGVCHPSAWLTCSRSQAQLWFLSAAPGVPKGSSIRVLSRLVKWELVFPTWHGPLTWLGPKTMFVTLT